EEDTENKFVPWERTDPTKGNRWCSRAQGKRVLAFLIWLYWDDTSGNVSKKWNKHNSFLFTAAGLPHHLCNKESNIHFFSTSNTAPPLEMLDGFVEQLRFSSDAQLNGVWAWDLHYHDIVLLVPSVLGLLEDNPMQRKVEAEDDMEKTTLDEYESDTSVTSNSSAKTKGGKKSTESMADMIMRITNFISCASLRTRTESCAELKSQFIEGSRIGGGASFKRMKTESGVKDTYQAHFIDKIQAIAMRKALSKDMKQWEIERLKHSLPQHLTSPVWHIKGLDPHQDTPVKILHVILLGVVKYHWRDAVARTKKDHNILIGHLSSFNTWGLGLSPLPGKTLVNYAGSFTGWDFQAVVQATPFVLYGLLSGEQLETWKALSSLASLVWQPEIHDIDEYIPKFHVLLHLPAHICQFGPAMLFATEGFESFNVIIRARSVHSNRHAPSKDIAHAMARSNHVRHLLNGGSFWTKILADTTRSASKKRQSPVKSFHQRLSESPLSFVDHKYWRKASSDVQSLLGIIDFDAKLLGLQHDEDSPLTDPTGFAMGQSSGQLYFANTLTYRNVPFLDLALEQDLCRTFKAVCLQSGDKCEVRNWVIWNRRSNNGQIIPTVGIVIEILQMMRSPEGSHGLASHLTIDRAITGEYHPYYGMRHIELTGEFAAVAPQDVLCVVNIVHEAVRREMTNWKQKSSGPSKSSALQANIGSPVSHLQANPRRNQYQPATPSTLSHQNNLSPMEHSSPVCLPEMNIETASGRHLGNTRMGFELWELEIYLLQNMEGDDNAQPMQVNETPVHQSHATAAEIVGDPVMFSYNVVSRFNLSEQNRADLGELVRCIGHMEPGLIIFYIYGLVAQLKALENQDSIRAELGTLSARVEVILDQTESNPVLTKAQKDAITTASKFAVWDPRCIDFSNDSIVNESYNDLKANKKLNSFKAHFDDEKHKMVSTIQECCRKQASYGKTTLHMNIIKFMSVGGTKATEGISRAMCPPSTKVGVEQTIRVLLLHEIGTLGSGVDENTTTKNDSSNEAWAVAFDKWLSVKINGTEGNDDGWERVTFEQRQFPQDAISLIPPLPPQPEQLSGHSAASGRTSAQTGASILTQTLTPQKTTTPCSNPGNTAEPQTFFASAPWTSSLPTGFGPQSVSQLFTPAPRNSGIGSVTRDRDRTPMLRSLWSSSQLPISSTAVMDYFHSKLQVPHPQGKVSDQTALCILEQQSMNRGLNILWICATSYTIAPEALHPTRAGTGM
ncbi:hypothetical protein EV368DRAFT_70052, partial [Lentinula lateritia]